MHAECQEITRCHIALLPPEERHPVSPRPLHSDVNVAEAYWARNRVYFIWYHDPVDCPPEPSQFPRPVPLCLPGQSALTAV